MSSKVLGDNPFETPPAAEPPAPEPAPAPAPAPEAEPVPGPQLASEEPPPPEAAAPAPKRARKKRPARPKTPRQPAPRTDEESPDTTGPDEDMIGIDASTHPGAFHEPPPQYGRTLEDEARADSERRGLVDEFRLVERWVRDRIQPEPPPGERRKLPLEFLWRRWRDIAMRDRSDYVDEFGRDPMYAARMDPIIDFVYSKYFRVEVGGVENVPHVGRALIVCNHSGTVPYDGAMLMFAVRKEHAAHREVRPLVEDFVFHFPYLGTFINRIGGVRACQENAERLLRQDQLVAVFPEGIKGIGKLYRERYRLQRFGRGGFIKLALRTDAPILPAAVIGAEEIHPMLTRVEWLAKSVGIPYLPITPTFPWLGPLGMVPLPTKWYIQFGEPLYFNTEYGAAGAEDRILVNRLSEQVRSKIQEMVDDRLEKRRSVLFG